MAPGLSGEAGVDFETFDEEAASAAESRGGLLFITIAQFRARLSEPPPYLFSQVPAAGRTTNPPQTQPVSDLQWPTKARN